MPIRIARACVASAPPHQSIFAKTAAENDVLKKKKKWCVPKHICSPNFNTHLFGFGFCWALKKNKKDNLNWKISYPSIGTPSFGQKTVAGVATRSGPLRNLGNQESGRVSGRQFLCVCVFPRQPRKKKSLQTYENRVFLFGAGLTRGFCDLLSGIFASWFFKSESGLGRMVRRKFTDGQSPLDCNRPYAIPHWCVCRLI